MTHTPLIETPGIAALWTALPEARIVGGAVRDALAGQPVSDVDFASPLLPDAIISRLRAAGIKAVPTGIAHGTVTAIVAGQSFEVTTLRRDIATDGRHATVAFTADWQADAQRRDFTINAMSAARDGTVHDYFGGQDDLAAGRVRFVGAAETRIGEDYLRILRFFRFWGRYGRGAPDTEAVTAITALKAGLAQLSAERVWSELKLLLALPTPQAALALMAATGVLAEVVPRADLRQLGALLARGAPADPLLRLAALSPEDVAAFAAAKKLSLAEQDRLRALRQPFPLTPASTEVELRRVLADEPAPSLIARSWLAQRDDEPGWDALRERIAALPRPRFPLQGRDLLPLGFEPGPLLGQRLRELRDWWLQGGCVAGRQACLDQLSATQPR